MSDQCTDGTCIMPNLIHAANNTTHDSDRDHGAAKRPRFDPVALGLPEDFVLTDYTRLKGCSCKLPQPKLLQLLHAISTEPGKKDVGMDCSIVPVRKGCGGTAGGGDLSLVSTTDFFFPSVEDPFLQGQIGCANVLSDMYSMGIDRVDTVLMLLAASTDMDEDERYHSTLHMMKGFVERATLAGTSVTGGQTVMNPWPLIGGVAMAVVTESEMTRPTGIRVGDVLVLTKPLGNQIAVNLKQWVKRPSLLYKQTIEGHMTAEEIEALYDAAADNMKRLNRNGATLMRKHGAHAATDITGFGILGHARNLGAAQEDSSLFLELTRVPVMNGAIKASKLMMDKFKLFSGLSAETSGGLLVALPTAAAAESFVQDIVELDQAKAWIVGVVRERRADETEYAGFATDVAFFDV